MRILIDILHPAHVHFFRLFQKEMEERGHHVTVTAREKEMTTDLLQRYGVKHTVLSRQAPRKLGLAWELGARTFRLLKVARRVRPDVLTGIMGPSVAPVGRVMGIPSVVFYDTEHAWHTNFFAYRLAHSVCTPDCYAGRVPGRHVTYPGYHELAYLHPNRFTPDPRTLKAFGLSSEEPFFLLRFVSWQSIHDVGHRGLSPEDKLRTVEILERSGRVVISSERPLPESLRNRALRGPIERIHQVIAHARGIVGESATMCSEAAVLGVPSIFVSPSSRGYIDEQSKRYGIVRSIMPDRPEEVLAAVERLPEWGVGNGHRRLLEEKVDVTGWMIRFFEALNSADP